MNKTYYTVNNWLIDLPSGSVLHLITGERKRLGAYQLRLLDLLQQNAGKIFTREELTDLVWERRVIGNNSLPNAIHALRAALEDDGKQQRIIRTIPKRGYVLEPEYCRKVEREEEELNLGSELPAQYETERAFQVPPPAPPPPTFAPPTPPEAPTPTETLTLPQTLTPSVTALPASLNHSTVLLFAVLVIAFFLGALGYQAAHRNPPSVAQEIAKNVYSHIHLFVILDTHGDLPVQEKTYLQLKESFYILDQQLKSKSTQMSVFYHSVNQTLNYTFRLRTPCEEKILAMQIDHARSNPALLNNLILSETRRKLNEMASCNTP
ncbi:winged helix-turn-helix domain-containing protein [Kosakonia sp. BK9b]